MQVRTVNENIVDNQDSDLIKVVDRDLAKELVSLSDILFTCLPVNKSHNVLSAQ